MNIKMFLKRYQIPFIVVFMIIIVITTFYCAAYYKNKTYDWAKDHNNNYQSNIDSLKKTKNEQKQQFDEANLKTLNSVDTSKINIKE